MNSLLPLSLWISLLAPTLKPYLSLSKHSSIIPNNQKTSLPLKYSLHSKDIAHKIDTILDDKKLRRAQIGIVVMTAQGQVLYAQNANKLFIPASNTKLFTMATALHILGPQFRFITRIYADKPVNAKGVLNGNIYLKGGGDPSLRSEEMWRITKSLSNLGVRKITGRVYFDDFFFDHKVFGEGWKEHDHERFKPYLAAIGGLSMNFNTISIIVRPGKRTGKPAIVAIDPSSQYVSKILNFARTSSKKRTRLRFAIRPKKNQDILEVRGYISKHHSYRRYWRRISFPGWYTAYNFIHFLRVQNIKVKRHPLRKVTPFKAIELYHHKSDSLGNLLRMAGKVSSNFATEQILKTIGAKRFGPPGSWAKGLKTVKQTLSKIYPFGEYIMKNGSGLGRRNRFSPFQIATLLRHMLQDLSIRSDFVAAQPIAGQDGTLRKRMKDTPAQGFLRAKTGSLDGVSNLSGYVQTNDKQILIFSICMNGSKRQGKYFRLAQNKIGSALTQYPWK